MCLSRIYLDKRVVFEVYKHYPPQVQVTSFLAASLYLLSRRFSPGVQPEALWCTGGYAQSDIYSR
jgi:hypothetical protein